MTAPPLLLELVTLDGEPVALIPSWSSPVQGEDVDAGEGDKVDVRRVIVVLHRPRHGRVRLVVSGDVDAARVWEVMPNLEPSARVKTGVTCHECEQPKGFAHESTCSGYPRIVDDADDLAF